MLSLLAFPALLVLAVPAQAAFPGQNGKIAFQRGYGDVYTMNPDGSGQADLVGSAGIRETDPAWSGDGRRLAFTSDELGGDDIWTSNPDGSARTWEAGGGTFSYVPAWSPDSQKISFTGCDGDGVCSGVLTVVVHGGSGTPEPFTPAGDWYPAWSPNGAKVAMSNAAAVVTINPNNTGRTTLTTSGAQPNWSPDGSRIAFTSSRDGNNEIYVMDANGANQTRLTFNGASDSEPAWSPDGEKIAFTSSRDGNAEIYVMNSDGSGQTNLTNNPAEDWRPDWQSINYGYARPKGATKMVLRFVPAFEPCNSPNATHGSPLAVTSCSPPVAASDYLTVGTPDSNGAGANSAGSASLRTICNPPAPGGVPPCSDVGDQADEEFAISFTDVRQKLSLLDYTGELEARMTLRITDRWNGLCAGCTQPGTAIDVPLSFAVPCATTPDTSVGSTCSITTTANAVLPGTAREGKRSVWGLGSFDLYDGGPDGDADTPSGNTLFAVQGLFAP
jgi:TolB protein